MDEISLHLCDDIRLILKVSPILCVSSIKVLFFNSISKCDLSIWGLSTTDPVFPPRFLLDWNLLYFSRWPWSQLRRYRCDCWDWCSDVFFSETGRWVECATRKEASFLDLSAPHFSLLLPATWDTALSLRPCSHLGITVAPAWLTKRMVQGKQAWRLRLCHPAPIARLLSGMSYLRTELPPLVAVLYAEFPHAQWIAIPLQLNPIWL